jgi:hypothetical protein
MCEHVKVMNSIILQPAPKATKGLLKAISTNMSDTLADKKWHGCFSFKKIF